VPASIRNDSQTDALEAEIDRALAEHGGDARATIRDLLEINAYLEAARDKALDLVSSGYILRGPQRRAQ